jgi:hypothetical protein
MNAANALRAELLVTNTQMFKCTEELGWSSNVIYFYVGGTRPYSVYLIL